MQAMQDDTTIRKQSPKVKLSELPESGKTESGKGDPSELTGEPALVRHSELPAHTHSGIRLIETFGHGLETRHWAFWTRGALSDGFVVLYNQQ